MGGGTLIEVNTSEVASYYHLLVWDTDTLLDALVQYTFELFISVWSPFEPFHLTSSLLINLGCAILGAESHPSEYCACAL